MGAQVAWTRLVTPVVISAALACAALPTGSAAADEGPADWTEQQASVSGVTYYAGSHTIERNASGTVWRAYEENGGALDFVVLRQPDGTLWRYSVPSQYLRTEMATAARAYGFSPKALIGEQLTPEEAREFGDEWAYWTEDSSNFIETDDEGRLLRATSAGETIFEVLRYRAPRAVRPPRNQLTTTDEMNTIEWVGVEGGDFFASMHVLLGAAESQPRFTSDPMGALRQALRQTSWAYTPLSQGARVSMRYGTGAVWTAVIDVVPASSARYTWKLTKVPAVVPQAEMTARYTAGTGLAALSNDLVEKRIASKRSPTASTIGSWIRDAFGGAAVEPQRLQDREKGMLTWQVNNGTSRISMAVEFEGQCADGTVPLATLRVMDAVAAPGVAGPDGRCSRIPVSAADDEM